MSDLYRAHRHHRPAAGGLHHRLARRSQRTSHITQAPRHFELAELDKQRPVEKSSGGAMRVGRDHIASTVYTLVLAYAGGALPLLLLFSVSGRPLQDVLVGDAVAIEMYGPRSAE